MTSLSVVSSFDTTFKQHIAKLKKEPRLQLVQEAISMLEGSARVNAYSKRWEIFQRGSVPQPLSKFVKKLLKAVSLLKNDFEQANDLLVKFRVEHILPSVKKSYRDVLKNASLPTLKKLESNPTNSTPSPFLFDLALFHQHIARLKTNPKLEDVEKILQMLKKFMIASSRLNEYIVHIEKDRFLMLSFFIKELSKAIDVSSRDSDFYKQAVILLDTFQVEPIKQAVQHSNANPLLDLLGRKKTNRILNKSRLSQIVEAPPLLGKNIESISAMSEKT